MSKFVRHLTVGLAVAAVASATWAALVSAEPLNAGVRCTAVVEWGANELFDPGEHAIDKAATTWLCQSDGSWLREYSHLAPLGVRLTQRTVVFLVPPKEIVAR